MTDTEERLDFKLAVQDHMSVNKALKGQVAEFEDMFSSSRGNERG